jgi:hypothetical protein
VLWALFAGAVTISVGAPSSAFPIRVSTATELTLEPTVSPDRRDLSLAVHLKDDGGTPVENRTVDVRVDGPAGLSLRSLVRTDANGDCVVRARLGPQAYQITVGASFAGDDRFAPAAARAELNTVEPFVTVELSAPPSALPLSAPPPSFDVRVDTGRVAALSSTGLAVDVVSVESGRLRVIGAGTADATGLARVAAAPGAFPRAGIYHLRPRVEVRPGHPVEGAERHVLVRAETALAAAVVTESDNPRARIRGRLTSAPDRPVGGAAVRLMRGDETVSAARTDAAGEFVFELDLDRAQLAGATVRARFDPADPWLGASESGALRVGEAPSAPIHWAWMLAPWAMLAAAAAALALRRRAPAAAPESLPVDVKRDAVVRVGAAPDGVVELVVEAFDRSTGEALPAATYRAEGDGAGDERPSSEATTLARGQGLALLVRADGYEARRVAVARLGAGRHCVRVGLLGWREAVFDRARPALAVASDGAVMPTPREVGGAPWAAVIERGTYGPDAPGEGAVRAAERALGGGEATANDGSDAVDAVN